MQCGFARFAKHLVPWQRQERYDDGGPQEPGQGRARISIERFGYATHLGLFCEMCQRFLQTKMPEEAKLTSTLAFAKRAEATGASFM